MRAWVQLWDAEDVEHHGMMQALPEAVQGMLNDGFGVVAGGYVLRCLIGASCAGVDVDVVTCGIPRQDKAPTPPTREMAARALGERYLPAARGWASAGGTCTRFQHRWLAEYDVDVIFASWPRNTIRSWDATCSQVYLDASGVYAHADAVRDILAQRLVLVNAPNDTPRLRQRMVKLLDLLKHADADALDRLRVAADLAQ